MSKNSNKEHFYLKAQCNNGVNKNYNTILKKQYTVEWFGQNNNFKDRPCPASKKNDMKSKDNHSNNKLKLI